MAQGVDIGAEHLPQGFGGNRVAGGEWMVRDQEVAGSNPVSPMS